MKRALVILLVVAAGLALGIQSLGAQSSGAKEYVIQLRADGTAVAVAQDAPAFVDAGQKGWTLQALPKIGIDFYVFRAAAGAPFPLHKSDVEWIAYVVEGNGQLTLADASGKQTSVVNFKKGDFMVFEPNTMHGWKGGSADALIVFVTPTKK